MAASKVLVVGSGSVGLRTALELLRRNVSVALRASRHPTSLESCSVGAGGLWMPYHCQDKRVDGWALDTLDELYKEAALDDPTVELVHTVLLKRDHHGPSVKDFISTDYDSGRGGESPLPEWTTDRRLDFQHLTAEMLAWQNMVFKLRIPSEEDLLKLGYSYAWFFRAPIVDAPRMLNKMLQEVESHENTLTVEMDEDHEYKSLQDMVEDASELGCDALVNCTGLAAGAICNDPKVFAARGITLQYDRKSCTRREFRHDKTNEVMVNDAVIMADEPPFGTETEPCYLIPRGDTLVVGGSALEGDTATTLRPEERERLLGNAWNLGINVKKSKPVANWTGFRPCRETVRCEVDKCGAGQAEGVTIVHNYGHGGSGWTINVGTAKQVARLLKVD